MKRTYMGINGNTYEADGTTITNMQTGEEVTRAWAYPVRQGVWGADGPITLYFASAAARDAYMAGHDYCDKLPRCKVESDCLEG